MIVKRKSILFLLLSLILMLWMIPGISITAYANTPGPETWSENINVYTDKTYENGVKVTSDITLTIDEDATVTVNGGIDASSHTLTVTGEGTLIVTGNDGNDGKNDSADPLNGSRGGDGFTGNIIINGASVTLTGGCGGKGGNSDSDAASGGSGGSGITGNITVNNDGSAIVTGGKGGDGGDSETNANGGNGGDGGCGIEGILTVTDNGTAIVKGGDGGNGGDSEKSESSANDGLAGNSSKAIVGTIATESRAMESENNTDWTDISGNSSEKQFVKVNPPLDVESIISNPTYADLIQGKTQQMEATILPTYADQTVKWSSSDTGVATVSESGLVTAVGAGSATITATATNGTSDTADDIKAKSTIHVSAKVTILIDVGKDHGDLFTDKVLSGLVSRFQLDKATIDGDTLTFTGANPFWSEGKMREEIDKAIFALPFGADNNEKYFNTGYKPLSEYSTYENFENALGDKEHDKKISDNLKYYLLWKKPYEKLEIGNGDPVCGETAMENIPAPTVPDGMYVHPGHSCWKDAEGNDFDTFEGGKEYLYTARIDIPRDNTLWKYYFNKDDLSVNVKDGKVENIKEDNCGPDVEVIIVTFRTTAVHEWDKDNGKVTKEPTCTEKGVKLFTCKHCTATTTEEVEIVDHKWDNGTVTKNATTTAAGIKTFTCKVCGKKKTASIPKLNKSDNPLTIKGKIAIIKYKKLTKKSQKLAVTKSIKFVRSANDNKSYSLLSVKKGKKSFKKSFKINNKTGEMTIKKGLKKGKYKVRIKIKASGNSDYNGSEWKAVTFKVKVK